MRDSVTDHVDPSETPHGRHLDQRILHRWIAQVVQLLQEIDRSNRIGEAKGYLSSRNGGRPSLAFVLG
jgi:hypothetical protein